MSLSKKELSSARSSKYNFCFASSSTYWLPHVTYVVDESESIVRLAKTRHRHAISKPVRTWHHGLIKLQTDVKCDIYVQDGRAYRCQATQGLANAVFMSVRASANKKWTSAVFELGRNLQRDIKSSFPTFDRIVGFARHWGSVFFHNSPMYFGQFPKPQPS